MVDSYLIWKSFAQAASKLKAVEMKLTNEQLEYLNQYYAVNKKPRPDELQLICKKRNMNRFYFFLDLDIWFYGRWMAEREIQERRRIGRKVAA